jgi:hypothetical protein
VGEEALWPGSSNRRRNMTPRRSCPVAREFSCPQKIANLGN